jgi:pseudouridine synthase
VERLQKLLSRAGVASRRAAEQLIVEGRVTVNGVTVHELGTRADPSTDEIRVDGRRVAVAERRRYLLLNKPPGYVTTRSDPQRRRTVMELLRGVREYVYPVGRLDYHSEGLLLLTNDGDLAARLTHPRHEVTRVYEVRVLGTPDRHDLERLSRGIVIEGRRTQLAEVKLLHAPRRSAQRSGHQHSVLQIAVREGRNRQVRKMCEAVGHPVDTLKRVAIGPIRDDRLRPGQWRELTDEEVRRLRSSATPSDMARNAPTPAARKPSARKPTKRQTS